MEGSSGDYLPQALIESRTLDEMIRGLSRPMSSPLLWVTCSKVSCSHGEEFLLKLKWVTPEAAYCLVALGILLKRISISVTTT